MPMNMHIYKPVLYNYWLWCYRANVGASISKFFWKENNGGGQNRRKKNQR